MAVAVPLRLVARRADQAPLRRSEPRIVEAVRRRRVRLVERSRFGDRADGNLAQLVGGVEAEGDAVDLRHCLGWRPARCSAALAVSVAAQLSAICLQRAQESLRDFCAISAVFFAPSAPVSSFALGMRTIIT